KTQSISNQPRSLYYDSGSAAIAYNELNVCVETVIDGMSDEGEPSTSSDDPIFNVIRVSTGAGTVERQFGDDLRITGGDVAFRLHDSPSPPTTQISSATVEQTSVATQTHGENCQSVSGCETWFLPNTIQLSNIPQSFSDWVEPRLSLASVLPGSPLLNPEGGPINRWASMSTQGSRLNSSPCRPGWSIQTRAS
ncbi:MAG: hypothetical protein AAF664_23740, partial [Planctomycetota bacterium]